MEIEFASSGLPKAIRNIWTGSIYHYHIGRSEQFIATVTPGSPADGNSEERHGQSMRDAASLVPPGTHVPSIARATHHTIRGTSYDR
ncbi:MAG: hypothetical protein HC801_04480 [Nitrospira sp.]|nr:hypothetical protein [Nitrospira sp.]